MNIQKLVQEALKSVLSEEYQGYKNFPTYIIAIDMEKDPQEMDHWIDQAKDIIRKNLANRPSSDPVEARQISANELAHFMKEYYQDQLPQGINGTLVGHALEEVDWMKLASDFMEDEVAQLAISDMTAPISLNESDLIQEMDLEKMSQVPDAEYMMVSVKGSGKDEQFGIMVMPRTLKMYFQDPIKLVNAIINERGSYKFVKYIKDHKDPNITPKPSFMQVFRSFKLETTELNPQHEPEQASAETASPEAPKA